MSVRNSLSRRGLLRGAGGVAIGLPFLGLMRGGVRAQPAVFPKRLVVFYTPNGFDPTAWPSSANLAGTTLEPLAPHWDDLVVAHGFDMVSGLLDPNPNDGAHYNGWAHCLVGDDCFDNPADSAGRTGGNISFDMAAADIICRDTPFQSSLQAVDNEGYALSWHGSGTPARPESDPRRVFGRLFSDVDTGSSELEQMRMHRRSILDFTRSSTERLRCRLGAEDRMRLEAHLESIRDVERRLEGAGGATCAVPAAPGSGLDYPATARVQMDLLVTALACDLTRVGSVQMSRAVSGQAFPWLGSTRAHHALSHDDTPAADEQIRRIDRWHAEQLAYLLERMKAVPEGEGTLLDNTAILWITEGSLAGHGREAVDVVIAGRAGGYLRTGQYLEVDGVPHNNLLVELTNAVLPADATPITTFGNPEACTGGVPKLRA